MILEADIEVKNGGREVAPGRQLGRTRGQITNEVVRAGQAPGDGGSGVSTDGLTEDLIAPLSSEGGGEADQSEVQHREVHVEHDVGVGRVLDVRSLSQAAKSDIKALFS